MKKFLLPTLIAILIFPLSAWSATVFNSSQVGSSPVNGYILQTNGSVSTWVPVSSGGGSGGGTFSTTTSSVSGQLINYPNNNTDIVNIGGTATTTGIYYFDPNSLTYKLGGAGTTTGALTSFAALRGTTLTATSTTGTSTITNALQIGASAGDHLITVTPTRNFNNSTSVGGSILLNNTSNLGAGMILYTNASGANGRLFSARCDNQLFGQDCANITDAVTSGAALNVTATAGATGIAVTSSGDGHSIISQYTGTSTTKAAGNFISTNYNFTAFEVSGQETDHGTVKITHTGTAGGLTDDANAAAISIDLQSSTTPANTAAQGLFINASTGSTTGALIQAKNNGNSIFKVDANGLTGWGIFTPRAIVDVTGAMQRGSPGVPYLTVSSDGTTGNWGNVFNVASSSNVGVSSTTPGTLFSVGTTNGINLTTGTSTFNSIGGVNLASGCYAIAGNCISGGGGGGGSGTVTSVALTVPSFLSVSGSPVTTSGTLAVTLSGTALPVLNGGTGQTTFGQGWVGINDAGAFVSSTSPTINYLTATSTTATSTFSGALAQYAGSRGFTFFNTANPNDNAEYVRAAWAGNIFNINAERTGTGTVRGISLLGNNTILGVGTDTFGGAQGVTVRRDSTTATGLFGVVSSNLNASSGFQNAITVGTRVSQTGTAGFRGLFISPFISTSGSAGNYLIDAGTNSAINAGGVHTSKFTIDDSGNASTSGNLFIGGNATSSYFTATSTTATSTLPNLAVTNISFGANPLVTRNTLYVNVNRADSYVEDGTINRPYKTLSAAIAGTPTGQSVAYYLDPGTYVEGAPDTFTTSGVTLVGNGSVIVFVNGATFPGAYLIRNVTFSGNVLMTDTSLTNTHALETVAVSGNYVLNAPFATHTANGSAFANGTINISTSSTFAATGGFSSNPIFDSGTLFWNGNGMTVTSNTYAAINATTTYAVVGLGGGNRITNLGTGGGVNIANGATSTPNEINAADINVGVGTPATMALNCASAASSVISVNMNDLAGAQYQMNCSTAAKFISNTLTSQGSTTASSFIATSSTASIFPYASSTAQTISGSLYLSGLAGSQVLVTGTGGVVQGNSVLPLSLGGTFASSFTTTGNSIYYDGTRLVTAPATTFVTTPYASTTAFTSSGNVYLSTAAANQTNIGTTTGYSKLTVFGSGTALGQTLEVANSASTTVFMVWDNGQAYSLGNFGIATTSPHQKLTVNGNAYIAGFVTSTSTTQASTFPYASTTALSGTTLCIATDCRTVWPSSSAVGGSDKQVQFNDGGSALGGSSGFTYDKTLTRGTLTYASTTALSTVMASSTQYFGANLSTCNSASSALTWAAGLFGCNSISGGSGTFSFTSGNAMGQVSNSTSTLMQFTGYPYSIAASSSAIIDGNLTLGGGAFNFASSTASTTISHEEIGNSSFDQDAGIVSWVDLPIVNAGAGIVQSYVSSLAGSTSIAVWGTSNGNGGVGAGPFVAIGTSTPNAKLTIWDNRSAGTAFNILNSASTTLFQVNTSGNVGIGTTTPSTALTVNGTITSTSTPPVLSGCGTSPTVIGNNNYGEVTAGATASGCTVTFATAYPTFASCTVTGQTGSITNTFSYTMTKSAITVTETGLGGNKFNYSCSGY